MGAIAGANASNRLSDNLFGFFLRNSLAGGVYLGKILSQLIRDFQFPPMRNSDWLEGTDADRFSDLKGGDIGHDTPHHENVSSEQLSGGIRWLLTFADLPFGSSSRNIGQHAGAGNHLLNSPLPTAHTQ
jgi:hypothetical protein